MIPFLLLSSQRLCMFELALLCPVLDAPKGRTRSAHNLTKKKKKDGQALPVHVMAFAILLLNRSPALCGLPNRRRYTAFLSNESASSRIHRKKKNWISLVTGFRHFVRKQLAGELHVENRMTAQHALPELTEHQRSVPKGVENAWSGT